jgi:hypothetical protein
MYWACLPCVDVVVDVYDLMFQAKDKACPAVISRRGLRATV